MELDPVKIVKCRICGVDIPVNANYPITEVGCVEKYCPKHLTKMSEEGYVDAGSPKTPHTPFKSAQQ